MYTVLLSQGPHSRTDSFDTNCQSFCCHAVDLSGGAGLHVGRAVCLGDVHAGGSASD